MDGKLRNMASLYLISEDKILLLYRMGSRIINNSYVGTAGGHFEKDELNNAKSCVLRELTEETELCENDIDHLALRYITMRLKNGEIRQNYYFFADLKESKKSVVSNEGRLKWFDLEQAMSLDMPHSAKYMFLHYIETGRFNNKLYGGISTHDNVIFEELEEF